MHSKYSGTFAILCLFYCIAVAGTSQQDGKMDVTILYESLCPDSVKFITHQLFPNWDTFSPYMNLRFVPFGKATSVKNGESFECQHGPEECRGNIMQSCVLHLLGRDPQKHMTFVTCQMSPNSEPSGRTCSRSVGLDWAPVERCMKSDIGRLLQLRAEKDTNSVWPQFIPTVVFNGIFNQELQDMSQTDFKKACCHFLRSSYPHLCQDNTIERH